MTIPARRFTATDAYRQASEVVAFEADHAGGVDARAYYSTTSGGGTVAAVAVESGLKAAVTTASGDRALLQSQARPRAAAGRGRATVIVGHTSGTSTGQVKRWGAFTDDDGYFFQLDGETLSIVRRTKVSGSVVETEIANAQWNVDSNTIEPTKTHVWEIREAWPNSDARFFVDGVHVHTVSTDASITGPAYVTARLPVAVEAENESAVAAAGYFTALACAALVEAAPLPTRSFGAHGTQGTVSTSAIAILSLRPKETFGGVANLAELKATRLTVAASGDCLVQVVAGGTVSSGSWAEPDAESLAQVNTGATLSGGDVVGSFVCGTSGLSVALSEVVRLLGDSTQDTLTVAVTRLGGSDISVRAALTWEETR
jgi:hypothetical protein